MLSLCKKEFQLENLLKKIVNSSEHKIYLLVQIAKFSNSARKVRWPQAATAASNAMPRGVSISCLTSPIR